MAMVYFVGITLKCWITNGGDSSPLMQMRGFDSFNQAQSEALNELATKKVTVHAPHFTDLKQRKTSCYWGYSVNGGAFLVVV